MSFPMVPLETLKDPNRYSFVGGPFGSNLTSRDYRDEGVPVIRGNNLPMDRAFRDEEFAFVSPEKADSLSSNLAYPGDLVFTQRGTLGQVGLIPPDASFPRYVLSQSQMKVTVDRSRVDARFLYYYFRHPSTIERVIGRAITSGVPHINLGILKAFEVPHPSLDVQRRIADALAQFDALTENNDRRIALCEEAARQLYQEWFVRLRFPGAEHVRRTDGIPEGWRGATLGECALFLSGGTPSKAREDYWQGEVPWVSSGELITMRIARTTLNISEDGAEAGSRLVGANTILAVVRGMSLAKEFRIGLTSRRMAFNQDLKAIVPRDGVSSLFFYHALDAQRDQIRDRAGEASHGTKKLDTPVLAGVPLLVPPRALADQFDEIVRPMHAMWDNLAEQNDRLRTARDLLLPRLMSGAIAV